VGGERLIPVPAAHDIRGRRGAGTAASNSNHVKAPLGRAVKSTGASVFITPSARRQSRFRSSHNLQYRAAPPSEHLVKLQQERQGSRSWSLTKQAQSQEHAQAACPVVGKAV